MALKRSFRMVVVTMAEMQVSTRLKPIFLLTFLVIFALQYFCILLSRYLSERYRCLQIDLLWLDFKPLRISSLYFFALMEHVSSFSQIDQVIYELIVELSTNAFQHSTSSSCSLVVRGHCFSFSFRSCWQLSSLKWYLKCLLS